MKKNKPNPVVIPALLVFGALFYYFGELVDWAAWESLRLNFFYGIHDVHRMFFLVPITYAGYNAGVKGALIVTLVSFIIFLPRAFFISPYPDPFLRMLIFVIIAGTLGGLTGIIRAQTARAEQLEARVARDRNRLLKIVDSLADGVVVTGPDYKIRFMNSSMAQQFGEGAGQTCYQHLHHLDGPCRECMIATVINERKICRWRCRFPDGRTSDIVAAPYTDADGVACQIAIFRDLQSANNSGKRDFLAPAL